MRNLISPFIHLTRQSPTYLCIHGHFYQPPRENPFQKKSFLNHIPNEPGAGKHGNFNNKITAECYRPNAEAGNFEYMSFDLGPTLADYLETHHPGIYQKILDSEKAHFDRFGVSNALAQPYNHTILPLSFHYRDKWLQIKWGIDDYRKRFRHDPTGMWLPETAVDLFTLWVMAWCGIEYTVLAPWQGETSVDTTEPYIVHLPPYGDSKGLTIKVFFYNRELSGLVSFNDSITDNADKFAFERLPEYQKSWKQNVELPQLTLIATDGELYGHHKPEREKFLQHLFKYSAKEADITVVSLGRYLQLHPPTKEVKIREYTSWSCDHGIARWETGCECYNGGGSNSWKVQYRQAFRSLYNEAYKLFEEHTRPALPAIYDARNDFLSFKNGWISDDAFWSRWGRNEKRPTDLSLVSKVLLLMEAEYYLQRSFTSCGTYWATLGIEAENNIRFAEYAISLINQATSVDLSPLLAELRKKIR